MSNSQICKLNIEKSTLALALEKELGVEWSLDQDTPLDAFYNLRACIVKDITIQPGECIPVPTGIYPELGSPYFVMEVTTNHDTMIKWGLSIFDSPMIFSYTFRNEIWVLIKNNFKEAQVIPPSKKVANLSIRQLPQTQLNYVTQIEQTEISLKTSKKFIRTIKNDMYTDIYGVKKEKFAEFYSREEIQKMIEKHNGS